MKFFAYTLLLCLAFLASVRAGPKKILPLYHPNKVHNGSSTTTIPILYHGGPIMLGQVNTYAIFYGFWPSSCDRAILTSFLSGISGTSYFNIEKTYYDGSNRFITGPVVYKNLTYDHYSLGSFLTNADIQTIVANRISSGALPLVTNAVYFVFTSPDVMIGDDNGYFCFDYCGWHNSATILGKNIKYSLVGNPTSCLDGCSPNNQVLSPNGNPGVDAMVSVVAHELMEAMSDPNLNAWYDANGYENADKCAYTYGSTHTLSGGAIYNIAFGGRKYLIQQNWDAFTQSCKLSA